MLLLFTTAGRNENHRTKITKSFDDYWHCIVQSLSLYCYFSANTKPGPSDINDTTI